MRWKQIDERGIIAALGVLLLLIVGVSVARDAREEPFRGAIWTAPRTDVVRGKAALQRYDCGACHVIPGIRTATGRVGPKLVDLHEQVYIAGVVINNPDNLASWIVDPQSHSPNTAMPNLAVPEADARDMAAYLLQPGVEDARR